MVAQSCNSSAKEQRLEDLEFRADVGYVANPKQVSTM